MSLNDFRASLCGVVRLERPCSELVAVPLMVSALVLSTKLNKGCISMNEISSYERVLTAACRVLVGGGSAAVSEQPVVRPVREPSLQLQP